jgi:hypothetical protein
LTAPDSVHELAAKFDQHQKEYQSHNSEATDAAIDRLVYGLLPLGMDIPSGTIYGFSPFCATYRKDLKHGHPDFSSK